jgi:FkbM family methyltransferase
VRRPELAPLVARFAIELIGLMSKPLGSRARVFVKARIMERLEPIWVNPTKFGPITLYCPATWPYSRSDMAKEPDTSRWVEGFVDGEVLWDVGANVGVFSLLAAKKGHRVVAFEPAAVNYFVLAKNVELNAFDDRITFLNIALTDHSRIDILHMSETRVGAAQHNFAVADEACLASQRGFKQPCIGYSVDDFVRTYKVPFPNHIKIDVDGIEARIIAGAKMTLQDLRLKSVLVEINSDEAHASIQRQMTEAGLILVPPKSGNERRGNQVFRRAA